MRICRPAIRNGPKFLSGLFDIFQPYQPHLMVDPGMVKFYQQCGRTIWTYHILEKDTAPTIYRDLSWNNAMWGFDSPTAFWCWNSYSGDPFYSYDRHDGHADRMSDWVTGFPDYRNETMLFSRRAAAWYQGHQEYRLITVCRDLIEQIESAGGDAATYRKQLDAIINHAAGKGSAVLDDAVNTLLDLAVNLHKEL